MIDTSSIQWIQFTTHWKKTKLVSEWSHYREGFPESSSQFSMLAANPSPLNAGYCADVLNWGLYWLINIWNMMGNGEREKTIYCVRTVCSVLWDLEGTNTIHGFAWDAHILHSSIEETVKKQANIMWTSFIFVNISKSWHMQNIIEMMTNLRKSLGKMFSNITFKLGFDNE